MDMTSFLNGHNAIYIAQLYERFLEDPSNVDAEWRHFFGSLNDDQTALLAELKGAPWAPNDAAPWPTSAPTPWNTCCPLPRWPPH